MRTHYVRVGEKLCAFIVRTQRTVHILWTRQKPSIFTRPRLNGYDNPTRAQYAVGRHSPHETRARKRPVCTHRCTNLSESVRDAQKRFVRLTGADQMKPLSYHPSAMTKRLSVRSSCYLTNVWLRNPMFCWRISTQNSFTG
jgi:hypothetical protein